MSAPPLQRGSRAMRPDLTPGFIVAFGIVCLACTLASIMALTLTIMGPVA